MAKKINTELDRKDIKRKKIIKIQICGEEIGKRKGKYRRGK